MDDAGAGSSWLRIKTSPHSVSATVERFVDMAASKGLKTFAVIDQRAEAEAVGLSLRETTLVIFGSPTAGTPVMEAEPLVALDLPLKVLVWHDESAGTQVGYITPEVLAARYGLQGEMAHAFDAIDVLTDAVVAG